MQNIILGVCIFLFSASIALCVYSASLLTRSIGILRYMLDEFEVFNHKNEIPRKEGTD